MVDPNEVPRNVPLFTMPSNATEVLERLRDSYSAVSERDALTGPIGLFWLLSRSL